ncbi:hypothetical protein DASC09_016430 [Saccharomycopsis crataegensis]|uniref:F-box domain-containing protein n=1 Tax=Saccharomycopsis crataegensis TaxID=43959 RepID=A0AAV5QJK2_9ASCO|nr:hypothetical protein DASC09_016430 [Saccharomycopsis crataegensis]
MPSPHIKTILQHHFPPEIIIRILSFLKLNDVISIRYNLHKWNHLTHESIKGTIIDCLDSVIFKTVEFNNTRDFVTRLCSISQHPVYFRFSPICFYPNQKLYVDLQPFNTHIKVIKVISLTNSKANHHVLETHDNELEGLNRFLHSLPNVIALFTNLNQLTLSHPLKELNFLCYKGRLHYNTSRLEKLYISVPLQDQNLSADLNDTADNPTWGLDKFQLPVLRQLVINNGKNSNVFLDGKCWSFLPNLTYLAVYNDRTMILKNFDVDNAFLNLRTLNIRHCSRLELRGKVRLIELQNLYLNDVCLANGEILDLSLCPKLKRLEIVYTNLRIIKGFDSKCLQNLYHLSLKNNHITEIKGLSQLRNLQELDLSRNSILKIENLNSLVNLKGLNLKRNKILNISDGLSNLKKLQVLDLSHNLLKSVSNVSHLLHLLVLNCSHNKISKISINFSQMKSLQILDLTDNDLKANKSFESWSMVKM